MGDSNMCAHYQAPTIKSVIEGFLGGIKDTEIGTLNKAVTDVWPGKIAPFKTNVGAGKWEQGCFGIMPHWAKPNLFRSTYNARTETVAVKPSFRGAWSNRRLCVVPVKEFYEPCYESGRAQTWAIKHRDLEVFMLAGLWETFKDAFGDTISSFTLLTIAADGHKIMGRMHGPTDEKRSVVVIPQNKVDEWLGAKTESDVKSHLALFEADAFSATPI